MLSSTLLSGCNVETSACEQLGQDCTTVFLGVLFLHYQEAPSKENFAFC